jgi:arylsulfatase A-like enzyme
MEGTMRSVEEVARGNALTNSQCGDLTVGLSGQEFADCRSTEGVRLRLSLWGAFVRRLLGVVALMAPMLAAEIAHAAPPSSPIRNVVLIVLDDQNIWPTMDGRAGDPYAGALDTPNIDAIANRGHVFLSSFAAVAYCSPSRASFLTGQTPFETHVLENASPWQSLLVPSQTLPGVMKAAGFKVGLFGKVFHLDLPASFRAAVTDEYLRNPAHWYDSGYPFNAGAGSFADSEHGDYINTSAAIDFITRHRAEPFFLALGIYKPHAPWVVPQKWFNKYPIAGIKLPPSLATDLSDVPLYMQKLIAAPHEQFLTAQSATPPGWPLIVQGYSASVSFADGMVGRLLQALTANNLDQNTAIVLVGDNGYHLGEKTILHKWTLWEEAIRVPLIIVDPAHPGPKTVGGIVQLPDIYPTILDLVGLPKPAWVKSTTLMPQLIDPTSNTSGPAISSMLDSILVRDSKSAYIRHPDGSEELYDMVNDRRQLTNKASDPAFASTKAGLAQQVESYAAAHSLFLSHRDGERIVGSAGRNVLSGGHKVTLVGGSGDDLYIVHNANVVVDERSGGGVDTVVALVAYTLPANLENLMVPERAGPITVRGNALSNYISVQSVNVTIYDGKGLDTIQLGSGTRVVLEAADNALDVISTFAVGQKIDLSLFGSRQTCSFDQGILRVNGEQVGRISGDFQLTRDVVCGCGRPCTARAS